MIFMVFFVAPPMLLGKFLRLLRVDDVSDVLCTYLFALRRETRSATGSSATVAYFYIEKA
jgi:hypothetical protein